MEIVGIGTDIVEINRLKNARYLDRLAEFIFLDEELKEMRASRSETQFVASRFAVKESVIKAYPGHLGYHDFAVLKRENWLEVSIKKTNCRVYKVFASLAHDFTYTVGYAIVCLQ